MNSLLRFTSHEFKTPVYAISATIKLALENFDLSPQLHEYLSICNVSCKQILYLSSNLMDYSALCTNQFIVHPELCSLQAFLSETESMIRILAERKGLEFIIEVDPGTPDDITIDPNRLQQVILNLLSNAIKFTKVGHVILKVQTSYYGQINFSVIDSGVGIAEEDMARLFQQFQMLGDRAENPNGHGIGLHISNRLLEALGGTNLVVSSKLSQGTIFSFDLPIGIENPNSVPDEGCGIDRGGDIPKEREDVEVVDRVGEVVGSGGTFLPKTYKLAQVLIADDTEFNRYALRHMLEQMDISVCEVDDGEEAVKQVKSRHEIGHMFKLIIMDVDMPIKNGWEATVELLSLKESGEIPEL